MEMVKTVAQDIPVDLIAVSGKNPRRTFDAEFLAEMAESMRQVGIIEPLVVRPGGDTGYVLVAGEQRLRAAKIAGLAEVPCVVRDYDDRQAREVQLVENLQRRNVTGIEEAEGFRELMSDYGYTAEQLAERVGRKPRVIYQRLALIELPAAVKDAMSARDLTVNHGILIARLKNPSHQAEALGYAKRGCSVRDLDRWIKQQLTLKLDAAPFRWADGSDAELVPEAGSCQVCSKRTGNSPLFDSPKAPNVCTDKECYELKVKGHINREIRRADGGLVQIILGYYDFYPEKKPKHVYDRYDYTLIDNKNKRCDNAVPAIVVFGDGVGEKATVCISPLCKKHKSSNARSSSSQRSEAELTKARAEKLKLEIARALRGRVVDAILDAGVVLGTSQLLETAADHWWEHISSDYRRLIRKRHPEWDADIPPVDDLPDEKLKRLLIEFSLVRDLMVFSYSRETGIGDGLRERAEAAGVDWKAIEQAVTAELSAPKKKAGKGKTLAEAFAGVESDNGVEIQLRARAKGPVLAEIVLASGAVGKRRLVEKFGGAEPVLGWSANITVKLAGEAAKKAKVLGEEGAPFESTTPALFAAYTRIGELAEGLGTDAVMVRDWTARKLAALAK
jgi:ParB/RepB/Spo0J family partition protein